ncbi:MAG: NYN domain-containing protein [Defluviitaleaceae bacterium]|nr:NYN domain-containing protein [Defluviitaleaceae bacterium]MCL2263576.1 NYN domain-containing protein [Defluviitaleaceae bacterium]
MHYLLVDGYNVIHANAGLSSVAADSLETARKKLCDALCEFRALSRYRIIVIFDAHLVEGGTGSVESYRGIKVVFTKEAETADNYIERSTRQGRLSPLSDKQGEKFVSKPDSVAFAPKRNDRITVATSDTLEQLIIMGSGAARISAEDLWTEIETARAEVLERYNKTRPIKKNPLESFLDAETAQLLEEMRCK